MSLKGLYYDINKLLSFYRILNFLIGARNIGKSFGIKCFCIRRFIKNDEQFVYVRRYKGELRKVTQFFDDIIAENIFPDHKFMVKGRTLYIDGKVAGFAIPLSTWQSEKSNAYPKVCTIFFDEFIREKDKSGYLPNEVESLLNLMDTVFRTRENVRCICASNAVTVVNPYFIYFNLCPDTNKRFNAYENIVIEIPDSKEFSTERRKTRIGKLIDGTEYGEMSLDNVFTNDSETFIERRSKESKFSFSVVYKGMTIGLWVDVDRGLMYMSNDHDPKYKDTIALTAEDHSENYLLFNNWRNHYHLGKMVKAFKSGYLRFDNIVLRNLGYELFKKMRVQ